MIEIDSIRSATEISLLKQGHRYVHPGAVHGGKCGFLWPRQLWRQFRWRCCQLPSRSPAEIAPTVQSRSHGAGRPPVGRCRSLAGTAVPSNQYCRSDDGGYPNMTVLGMEVNDWSGLFGGHSLKPHTNTGRRRERETELLIESVSLPISQQADIA
jgi:hypothetical protein